MVDLVVRINKDLYTYMNTTKQLLILLLDKKLITQAEYNKALEKLK